MKLAELSALLVRLPFRFAFRHALATHKEGHNVIVRAADSDGTVGFGEAVPRGYVTGETPEGAIDWIATEAARWRGRDFASFDDVVAALRERGESLERERRASFCALELALLDLAGRAFGRAVGDLVGPIVRDPACYSGVVSGDDVATAERTIGMLREFGARSVKVKVGQAEEIDVAILQAARETLGPECGLRVDANAAFTAEEALARIEAFAPFALEAIEQPVKADDWKALAEVTAHSKVPVFVDESLATPDDAEKLIAARACHGFNLRISKCGGLLETLRIRELARDAGLQLMLGAQVGETAILSAAGRQLATRCPELRFCEGSYGKLHLEDDFAGEEMALGREGLAPALPGHGLGVEVDERRIATAVVARRDVR